MKGDAAPVGLGRVARGWPGRLWLAGVLLMLYLPIAMLIVFSFNDDRRGVVWRGASLRHYRALLADRSVREALTNSLLVAAGATLLATVLGTLLAVGLWRFRFPGRRLALGVAGLPLVIPEICMGVGLMVFFGRVGWPRQLAWPLVLVNLVLAHATFCLPFVAVVVRARLARIDPALEEAARDLGAGPLRAFVDVVLPQLRPALIAGALLAFTLSLDDFVITFFVGGPDSETFPCKIYAMVRFSVSPVVNAASTVLVGVTLVAAGIGLSLGRTDG